MNPFRVARGDKSAMHSFTELLWTVDILWRLISGDIVNCCISGLQNSRSI